MLDHRLSVATRTVELAQLQQLNECLVAPGAARVTAGELGLLEGAPATRGLPPSAVLTAIAFDGPPEYPYIRGRFAAGSGAAVIVEMHTPALRELSRRLHLHHAWGV
jgi:hypothetical protein